MNDFQIKTLETLLKPHGVINIYKEFDSGGVEFMLNMVRNYKGETFVSTYDIRVLDIVVMDDVFKTSLDRLDMNRESIELCFFDYVIDRDCFDNSKGLWRNIYWQLRDFFAIQEGLVGYPHSHSLSKIRDDFNVLYQSEDNPLEIFRALKRLYKLDHI